MENKLGFRDIPGYEGIYGITSCGKVWSYKRKKFLANSNAKDGYLKITLSKNGQTKTYQVHRLVAEAYIPNPEGKPQVNHLDENKKNNYVSNLSWATAKENMNYGTRNERMLETKRKNGTLGGNNRKAVYCVELKRTFESTYHAARELGLDQGSISKCCNGKQGTCGKLHFIFESEVEPNE